MVPKMGFTAPWGAVGLPRGGLREKEMAGGAGGRPFRVPYLLIYD
jgi:hypothetical protein